MLTWLKSLFKIPAPAGPPQSLRVFRTSEPVIDKGGVSVDQDGWLVVAQQQQVVRLFEMQNPAVEQCMVTYRAKLKTDDLKGRAFLEMWCRVPGRGEFFSNGFNHAVKGTTDWATYEIPFYLRKGQQTDLIKLNLPVEGTGKVWIKEVEVLKTPLSS